MENELECWIELRVEYSLHHAHLRQLHLNSDVKASFYCQTYRFLIRCVRPRDKKKIGFVVVAEWK